MKKEVSRLIEGERDRRSPLKNLSLPPREKKNSLQNHSWLAITKFDASPALFGSWASTVGLKGVAAAWPSPFNREAWTFLAAFGSLQAALQLLLPGRRVAGPVTPRGNVPVYHANGVLSYFVTLALLGGAAAAGLWRPERVFDVFGEMLSSLNAFSLLNHRFLVVDKAALISFLEGTCFDGVPGDEADAPKTPEPTPASTATAPKKAAPKKSAASVTKAKKEVA